MTTSIVLDSGTYLASVLPNEALASHAKDLIISLEQRDLVLSAPVLLRYEIVATARKSVSRNRITPENAENIINAILRRPIVLYVSLKLVRRAYALSTALNLPTAYDAQYLAVAEHLGCDFWTADEKLVNSVSPVLPWVRWIGTWA